MCAGAGRETAATCNMHTGLISAAPPPPASKAHQWAARAGGLGGAGHKEAAGHGNALRTRQKGRGHGGVW
jgi:hypothetical protein